MEKNKIKNVSFTGAYDKKNELKYLKNVSIMNIIISDDINSKTLMTNRLYLSVSNGIPVMVNKNSTQSEYVDKYNLGISIESKKDILEKVTRYLECYNRNLFLRGREEFLLKIKDDQSKFVKSILNFINN